MLLLSLDTVYSYQNFTLYDCKNKKTLLLYGEDRGKKSLELFPKIFDDLNMDIQSVDLFAVNLGIGYSTSLRVGVTLAKTYAQISGKPLITYSTFEVLTEFSPFTGLHLTISRVSRYWVYGLWELTPWGKKEIQKPKPLEEKVIETLIGKKPVLVIPERFFEEFKPIAERLVLENTVKVKTDTYSEIGAKIACEKYKRGEVAELLKVEPIYFRPPV
jgi:tRNA threonylcarbamoyladenosine biosynthesis protein TsaB